MKTERRGTAGDTFVAKKFLGGTLKAKWIEPDVRDAIVDYVGYWNQRATFPDSQMLTVIGLSEQEYYEWKSKYGAQFKHSGNRPKDFGLTDAEMIVIIDYAEKQTELGYRRMCYDMMDADV